MKKLLFLLTLAAVPFYSFALLPPLYQSIQEYKALVDDPHLAESLSSGDFIVGIDHTVGDFTVRTNKRTLEVKVIYEKQDMPGAARFHFEFSPATPLETE